MKYPTAGTELGAWTLRDQLTFAEPVLYRAELTSKPETKAVIKVSHAGKSTIGAHRREATALMRLDHKNIPGLLDQGERDELRWVALSPFEGEPLADRLLIEPLRWRVACPIFQQLASALEHVHTRGMLHRDICPSKIWIDKEGVVQLLGFDLCTTPGGLQGMDKPPIGDLAYLAPEVIADPTNHPARADLYAFGCVMHETLTGESAFPAATMGVPAERERRMIEWKTRSQALDPGDEHPDWLRNLIRKSTHPNPDKRLPDVESLVGWFEAAESKWQKPEEPKGAPPPIAPMAPLELQPTALQAPPRGQAPVSVLYVGAAVAGVLTALALTPMLILFAESSGLL